MSNLNDAIQQVYKLSLLPNGWNYGRGRAVRDTTCEWAINVLNLLSTRGVTEFDVAPGRDGTVTVAGTKDGYEVEIQCHESGAYDIYATTQGEELEEQDLAFTKLVEELGGLHWLSTKSSISFIPSVIYAVWDGSQERLSKIPAMDLVFPLFVPNVPMHWGGCADISDDTPERRYVANRQSFGVSESPNYQPA